MTENKSVSPPCLVDVLDDLIQERRKRIRTSTPRTDTMLAHGRLSPSLVSAVLSFLAVKDLERCTRVSSAMYTVVWERGVNQAIVSIGYVPSKLALVWHGLHRAQAVWMGMRTPAKTTQRILDRTRTATTVICPVAKTNADWFAQWLAGYASPIGHLELLDTDRAFRFPPGAVCLDRLSRLRVHSTILSRESVEALKDASFLGGLVELDLSLHLNSPGDASRLLSVVNKCTSLQDLTLCPLATQGEVEQVLAELPTTLTSLSIASYVSPGAYRPEPIEIQSAADCLFPVSRLKQLKRLLLDGCQFEYGVKRAFRVLTNDLVDLREFSCKARSSRDFWRYTRLVGPEMTRCTVWANVPLELQCLNEWLANHPKIDKKSWWRQFCYLTSDDFTKLNAPSLHTVVATFRQPSDEQLAHVLNQGEYKKLTLRISPVSPDSKYLMTARPFETKRPCQQRTLVSLALQGNILFNDELSAAIMARFPCLSKLEVRLQFGMGISLASLVKLLQTIQTVEVSGAGVLDMTEPPASILDALRSVLEIKGTAKSFYWILPIPPAWRSKALALPYAEDFGPRFVMWTNRGA